MIICEYTQEGGGLVERHERLFEAKTYSPQVRTRGLRQLLVFITRENASLAPLTHLITKNGSHYRASELIA